MRATGQIRKWDSPLLGGTDYCSKARQRPIRFIGKFQALLCDWGEAPIRIAQLLIKYPKAVDAFIAALRLCSQFEEGNTLSRLLHSIDKISQSKKPTLSLCSTRTTNFAGALGSMVDALINTEEDYPNS